MKYALIFSLLFLLITFGFSAFEKIVDFKSSVNYYQSYFKNTFIGKPIKPILMIIIILEGIASALLLTGIVEAVLSYKIFFGELGIFLSTSILCIFLIGQRLVKDYESARGIALYFLICFAAFTLTALT
ncbi:hypothetical protein ACI76W_02090 [Capnocytophaga canimorsus]|uniref:hypothetical protein n=1 Tax=Capnocytophaga canimorsus TaxID=28188 RepID=UPI00385D674D